MENGHSQRRKLPSRKVRLVSKTEEDETRMAQAHEVFLDQKRTKQDQTDLVAGKRSNSLHSKQISIYQQHVVARGADLPSTIPHISFEEAPHNPHELAVWVAEAIAKFAEQGSVLNAASDINAIQDRQKSEQMLSLRRIAYVDAGEQLLDENQPPDENTPGRQSKRLEAKRSTLGAAKAKFLNVHFSEQLRRSLFPQTYSYTADKGSLNLSPLQEQPVEVGFCGNLLLDSLCGISEPGNRGRATSLKASLDSSHDDTAYIIALHILSSNSEVIQAVKNILTHARPSEIIADTQARVLLHNTTQNAFRSADSQTHNLLDNTTQKASSSISVITTYHDPHTSGAIANASSQLGVEVALRRNPHHLNMAHQSAQSSEFNDTQAGKYENLNFAHKKNITAKSRTRTFKSRKNMDIKLTEADNGREHEVTRSLEISEGDQDRTVSAVQEQCEKAKIEAIKAATGVLIEISNLDLNNAYETPYVGGHAIVHNLSITTAPDIYTSPYSNADFVAQDIVSMNSIGMNMTTGSGLVDNGQNAEVPSGQQETINESREATKVKGDGKDKEKEKQQTTGGSKRPKATATKHGSPSQSQKSADTDFAIRDIRLSRSETPVNDLEEGAESPEVTTAELDFFLTMANGGPLPGQIRLFENATATNCSSASSPTHDDSTVSPSPSILSEHMEHGLTSDQRAENDDTDIDAAVDIIVNGLLQLKGSDLQLPLDTSATMFHQSNHGRKLGVELKRLVAIVGPMKNCIVPTGQSHALSIFYHHLSNYINMFDVRHRKLVHPTNQHGLEYPQPLVLPTTAPPLLSVEARGITVAQSQTKGATVGQKKRKRC